MQLIFSYTIFFIQDSDDEDDEDGSVDDDDEGELLESDEDEIDDESQMYLESLQKKVTKAAEGSPFQVTASVEDGKSDDEDDDEDDDFYDETNLEAYTTTIDEEDAVDEYHVFKTTLEGLQSTNQEWYAAITGVLSQEQTKNIQVSGRGNRRSHFRLQFL